MANDTIFALSSAPGKSAIAVYRLSGPNSYDIITTLSKQKSFKSKRFYRGLLQDQETNEIIDDVMYVFFGSPNSYTGEDMVEIYTHGSIAVGKSLISSLLKFPNVRYAEAGEFSKRALLNGKQDLTKIEGLMDLINSETEIQKKQAQMHMSGYFYDKIEEWRSNIVNIQSLLEAFIDFPDEEIPKDILDIATNTITELKSSLKSFVNDNKKGERLRHGIKLAIYGKPNVGKSSLLNYLSGREAAIVSNIAGTTRDTIETHVDIGGYPIILQDTAGLRDSSCAIEIEGIKRAKKTVDQADIKIHMITPDDYVSSDTVVADDTILVMNKIDLHLGDKTSNIQTLISVKKNIGLDLLLEEILNKAAHIAGSGNSLVINERHRSIIVNAIKALDACDLNADLVLAAEDLRICSRVLGALIGKIDSEDILNKIFSSFCIGK
ncbi:MAG: tRNA uridine-5-carboxymethylaminomethyl(34) synthesis GTPase MnmE [Rickettsiaceae bacterium]|nr:tRNA uridine-5-carboxymethylaminomethyl(34) synthesis GTPase MnmE [Rickettsiaceae bacterium]